MTPDERWLTALWPSVHAPLPPPPARVLEIGCGPAGGFVPMLGADGYAATGIDPEAPEGAGYRRIEFERYRAPQPADAIVACTSLHHVADLGQVLDLTAAALVPDGVLVVVEWARERFDEATAEWCFARLPGPGEDRGWLNDRYEQWQASGQPWGAYCRSWADGEGLHPGGDILRELQARFDTGELSYGAYFFPDLHDTSEADEDAAIDAGQIRANRIQWHGRRRGARA
jgi:SAM-dependent methyltransferase